ncbi:penicillin-binding protein 2 [Desulfuromonas acetoxidans]|uniref:penicillin-binding protein 2 n=1 Tax=Desulfuromonas acetoxidans TaxID=891 RepID=UPI002930A136|nr:penicillin-binding protein 2 [Desulfuromonas acetoxidans]
MALNSPKPDDIRRKRRFELLMLAAIFFFALLAMRLWYLQIISGERYQLLSQKNRTRYIPIAAPRGTIYDRNGQLLVDNRPSFTVSVLRQEVTDKEQLLKNLAGYLHSDWLELAKVWDKKRYYPRYRPIPLKSDIDRDTLEQLAEHSVELPGMLIEVQPMRAYPYREVAAHLFGHIGAITEKELASREFQGYRAGEFIGKSGLEKHLETYLKGQAGERLLEVDVKGKELRQLQVEDPLPGKSVYLTLDRDLQLATEEAFDEQAGAAVVLDVNSGDILAMVSRPAFDPALFARGISQEEWQALVKNPDHPLQAKAISGQYPPGSTYKMVTALAALRAGVVTPDELIDCKGRITLGSRDFRCWKKTGHGPTNLNKALRESCDVWFYEISLRLGIERMSTMARELGLGRSFDLPLDNEKAGLIPDKTWKRNRYGASWYKGETVIAAIGQGYVLATPLQLAVMTATIANGGTLYQPQLVRRIADYSGRTLKENEPVVLHQAGIKNQTLKPVKKGMEQVVNHPRGTGKSSWLADVTIAAKTGTAQVVKIQEDPESGEKQSPEEVAYRLRDHALFVAYAPAEDPQIAIAVIVEHGQHGGSAAGPIARKIFENYFKISPGPEKSAAEE